MGHYEPNNNRQLFALGFFKRRLLRNQWLWGPVINQLIDLLKVIVKVSERLLVSPQGRGLLCAALTKLHAYPERRLHSEKM